MIDLIVIGAGLAGLSAAYAAAKAGRQVKIIAKGLGALHWSAGTIDVLGYFPDDAAPVERPLESIQELVRAQPKHPYAIVKGASPAEALEEFAALTEEIGLPYRPAVVPGQNLWLPSPVGAARPTFLAPLAQLGGDLRRTEPMLIVGFRGLRDFYPEWIAENLSQQGIDARAAFMSLELITPRHDDLPVHLARELDDPARRRALAAELKQLAHPGERIGLPAILGMDDHAAVMNDLERRTGAVVFEIPTLPPSVPGMRLNAALQAHLRRLGVRIEVNMDVTAFRAEKGRVLWVETQTSGRPLVHRGDKFLLATGGILGGGLNSDHTGSVWDTVFNLPLAIPPHRGEWFRARFLDPAGHAIFHAGLSVNSGFQPVDESGTRVYENVWAAGSVLAHADPILERSLEGIAVATGMSAARSLAH